MKQSKCWRKLLIMSLSLDERAGEAEPEDIDDFTGETRRVVTEQRMRQNFFRSGQVPGFYNLISMSRY